MNSLCTILRQTSAAGESGTSLRKDLPSSQLRPILGSRGTLPNRGRFKSAHILSAPPLVGGKICDVFYKKGQGKSKNKSVMQFRKNWNLIRNAVCLHNTSVVQALIITGKCNHNLCKFSKLFQIILLLTASTFNIHENIQPVSCSLMRNDWRTISKHQPRKLC